MKKIKKRGMTIPEVLISVTLGALLMGIVLSMWYFAYKNWTVERVRTTLRIDLETAMERIKEEVRLSSATYISLYKPLAETEYTAVSFPMATPDANGFFTLTGGAVEWDRSVIYHIYDNPGTGNTELRRTEFANNNAVLIVEAQRYNQLVNAVDNGDGSGGPNAANATTTVIFDNLGDFTIDPVGAEFDGYSPATKRSDNVEFGSIRLTPGNHDLRFEVTGQNSSSTGCELGIDTISITPSGCQRETEIYAPVASSGDANSIVGPDVRWSGNHHYEYRANAEGDFVTFRLYYDKWIESNFENSIRNNAILTGDYIFAKLPDLDEGNEINWQAEVEAGSNNGDAVKADYNDGIGSPKPLTDVTVRNLVFSANLDLDGDLLRVKFDSHSLQSLTITSAYLDERASGQDSVNPPTSATRIRLYFTDGLGNITTGTTVGAGSSAYSNWSIFPTDTTKDYFITFHITSDAASSFASYWAGTEPADINSYLIGGDYAMQAAWPAPSLPHGSDPALDECVSSANIYAAATLEIWVDDGIVTSTIYDTKIADPVYNQIGWDGSSSGVTISAGSSDDSGMAGAHGRRVPGLTRMLYPSAPGDMFNSWQHFPQHLTGHALTIQASILQTLFIKSGP